MGAEQSRSSDEQDNDKVFSSGRPIAFSEDLVNHLEDTLSSPSTSASRQGTLDAHVQARIAAELERLRAEEGVVREEIESALERENLDREKALSSSSTSSLSSSSGSDGEVAKVGEGEEEERNLASSAAIADELESVQRKVERFQKRRELEEFPEVKVAREEVLECYTSNPTTPLDCTESVERFKSAVSSVERSFVESLRS